MRSSRKLAIAVTTALSVGAGLGGTTAHADDSPVEALVRVGSRASTTLQDGMLIQQTPANAGRVHVTISRDGREASAIVEPGAVVKATWAPGAGAVDGTRAGSASVEVTPPSDAKSDPSAHAKAYQASGRSVITDAMEMGLTHDEAMRQFGDMAPELNPTRAQAEIVVRRTRLHPAELVATTPAVATATAATPYDSWCTDVIANGGDQSAHACIIRYLDYSSAGLRYFTHKQKVTAKDDSFWMVLSSATQWYVAPSGNTVVDWDPMRTESIGSCGTVTLGATDPKTGTSMGYSGAVCPNKFGPTQTDYNRGFGSFWGGTSNDYVGAHSISVVKVNPGYSSNGTLKASMSWRLN